MGPDGTTKRTKDAPGVAHGSRQHLANTGFTEWLQRQYRSLSLVIRYVYASNRKEKRSFAIGYATVFLVVAFLTLVQNALSNAPLVFLKIAEEQLGQLDMVRIAFH